jgi:DtxR family Mn-dependent transcriptional regulator
MTHLSETIEDYLKAIYIISKKNRGGWVSNSELSEYLNIKPPSVTDMLHKLKDKGLIYWKPRSSIRLKEKGKRRAEQILSNYKHFYKFCVDILEIDDKSIVNDLCCKVEHHLSSEINNRINDLLVSIN